MVTPKLQKVQDTCVVQMKFLWEIMEAYYNLIKPFINVTRVLKIRVIL